MLDGLGLHFLAQRSILSQRRPHHLIVRLRRLGFAHLQIARDDRNRAGAVLLDVKKSLVARADKTLDPDNFYFLNWFHYQGDTFMVFDNVRRVDGFHDGMDQIVKLTGLIDLNSGYTLTLDLLH